jgi:hypothetical protein
MPLPNRNRVYKKPNKERPIQYKRMQLKWLSSSREDILKE